MERRRLGRTGHESSVAILGGAAFARATPEQATAGFARAVESGVNHLDIAPRYGDAELLVGPLLAPVRDRLFVAAKTSRRAADGVRAQLEESLARLRTERLELYQLHAVTSVEVLDERAAAVGAIFAAREEGLTRFVGITGHDMEAPATFIEALRRYDLDTVMFPVNARLWSDPAYRAQAEALLDLCRERDVGVMAIKAVARAPWGEGQRFATTWYEPWTDQVAVDRSVRFALSVPGVQAVCTPGDLRALETALTAAGSFMPMDAQEREAAVAEAGPLPLIFPMPT